MSRLRKADAARRVEEAHGPDFSEALARGLKIITAFDAEHLQMTLSDVARVVDLPRATARRALYTLNRLGYVESDGKLFRLTPKILALATAYLNSNLVPHLLQPACERMCREIDASCSVAVLDAAEVVMVARATSVRPITAGLGVGYRLPAFCSSLGRVLLSALPDDRLDVFLRRLRPARVTSQTVTDKSRLKQLIVGVRKKGYALVDQEAEIGFRSIAVPVRRYDGAVVAAMNLGVPVERAPRETMVGVFLPALQAEVERLKNQVI